MLGISEPGRNLVDYLAVATGLVGLATDHVNGRRHVPGCACSARCAEAARDLTDGSMGDVCCSAELRVVSSRTIDGIQDCHHRGGAGGCVGRRDQPLPPSTSSRKMTVAWVPPSISR